MITFGEDLLSENQLDQRAALALCSHEDEIKHWEIILASTDVTRSFKPFHCKSCVLIVERATYEPLQMAFRVSSITE